MSYTLKPVLEADDCALLVGDGSAMKELIDKCISDALPNLNTTNTVKIFGRTMPEPRNVLLCCDDAKEYNYSNSHTKSTPLTDPMKKLLDAINTQQGYDYNSILYNRYPDMNASIGEHGDKNLPPGEDVVGISVGAPRDFVLKYREAEKRFANGKRTFAHPTGNYEVMHMKGADFQKVFLHSIPKSKKPVGERISLTFRKLSDNASPAGKYKAKKTQ